MVLELVLHGNAGIDVCREVRERQATRARRVSSVTAKGEEDHIVTGLGCGADDYVTKPFSPRVLTARIEAALRRAPETAVVADDGDGVIARHGMEIHPGRHEVRVDGENVHLTASEFTILALLAGRPGWVFSRQQIIDQVRGYDYSITPRAVDVQIFGLRRKPGPAGACIETARGIGYRLRE